MQPFAWSQPSSPPCFPRVGARGLDGRSYSLPEQFGGALNLLVVAFETWQQRLVDRWFAPIEAISAALPELRAYELPVIASRYLPARSFIDGGMAKSIPSPAVRARTLTIYTDIVQFQAATGIVSRDTVSVLLVTRDGQILWRGQGEPESGQLRALAATIATYTAPPSVQVAARY